MHNCRYAQLICKMFVHFQLALAFSLACAVGATVVETTLRDLEERTSTTTKSSAQPPLLPLKDCASFPIGTVWSAGHSPWGDSKGTDLGGPNHVFEPGAFTDDVAPPGSDWSTIVQKQLNEEMEFEVLRTEFNSITPEVALKPHNIATGPNDIDFAAADTMMAFAQEHGMRVHGHALLFSMSIPPWAREYETNATWDPTQWSAWLENYIKTVVGRYKGRIASWDVLNEPALLFGGGLKTDVMFWWRVMGDDYIEKAFLWAAEADPDAKLFINENSMEIFPSKLRDVLNLASDLRSRGFKVDGIGFQGHVLDGFMLGGYQRHKQAFQAASNEGYLVHMSELDVGVNVLGIFQGQQWLLQHWIQRQSYNNIARAYLDGVDPENRWGITLWNISDPNSFLNIVKVWLDFRIFGGKEYPLLWDSDYARKPAYFGFRNGLQGVLEWWFWPFYSDT